MNTGLPQAHCDAGYNGFRSVINPEKNDFIYFCASVERLVIMNLLLL
jgi:cell division protein YceG involved in septum cleavage